VADEDQLIMSLKEQCAMERQLESAKVVMTSKPDFNLYDAFYIFDRSRVGSISVLQLREGLN
jgi:hypothetical protein